jgi:hypothetical protein
MFFSQRDRPYKARARIIVLHILKLGVLEIKRYGMMIVFEVSNNTYFLFLFLPWLFLNIKHNFITNEETL